MRRSQTGLRPIRNKPTMRMTILYLASQRSSAFCDPRMRIPICAMDRPACARRTPQKESHHVCRIADQLRPGVRVVARPRATDRCYSGAAPSIASKPAAPCLTGVLSAAVPNHSRRTRPVAYPIVELGCSKNCNKSSQTACARQFATEFLRAGILARQADR
jgi:hypothetical protein